MVEETGEQNIDPSSDEPQDVNLEDKEAEGLNEGKDSSEEEEEDGEEEDEDKPLSRKEQRIKELIAEKNAYQRLAESKAYQQPSQEAKLPEMDPELEEAVNARLNLVTQQYQQQLGRLVEKLDETEAKVLPGYEKAKAQIAEFREAKAAQGIYFTREEAYDLLRGKGQIKVPPSGKKVSVVKSKPKVGIERKTAQNAKITPKKAFSAMTLEEKEAVLSNQTF